ncbi:MAG: VOC family protein [Candidatus Dormiibacterota bacterium]
MTSGDAEARASDRATPTGIQIVFDCHDPDALASFWAAALGYEKQWSWDEGTVREMRAQGVREDQVNQRSAAVDPAGARPRLFFQRVPEPKTIKNRVHLDLHVGREVAEDEVARLETLGARRLRVQDEAFGPFQDFAIVMQDPEGNEFCVS